MARFDRVIPPGQEGTIVAAVDTHKYHGRISKSVKVRTNDPKNAVAALAIEADVRSWVEVLPSWSANLTSEFGRGTRKTLYVRDVDPDIDLDITAALSENQWVKPSAERIPPGDPDEAKGDFRLNLELLDDHPVGPVTGTVSVTTSRKTNKAFQIALAGHVHGPIAVFPATVNMFSQASSGRPPRLGGSITLQARPTHPPFEVKGVEADDERIELQQVLDPANKRHRVSVRWKGEETAKGDYNGIIKIRTSSPDMPEITVPYRVRIL